MACRWTAAVVFTVVVYFVASSTAKWRQKDLNNDTPIVGILSQAVDNSLDDISSQDYINANYVKFVESAGGRVVPILTNLTDIELKRLFASINGVLFPGGEVPLISSGYYHTAHRIYKLALEANDRGDYFPLWGTCLGLQTLVGLRVGSDAILSHSNSVNLALPLNLTNKAPRSRIFSKASLYTMKVLATQDVTFNYHVNCVRPDAFDKYTLLKDFYTILSTNFDRDGREFISTIEAVDYPFYGVQWHPEMNSYATSDVGNIDHSEEAIVVTQAMANFFVGETRKSHHRFRSRLEAMEALIQNRCPRISHDERAFDERYMF